MVARRPSLTMKAVAELVKASPKAIKGTVLTKKEDKTNAKKKLPPKDKPTFDPSRVVSSGYGPQSPKNTKNTTPNATTANLRLNEGVGVGVLTSDTSDPFLSP